MNNLLQNREIELMEKLVSDHGAGLYAFCRRLTPSRTDADDLYQQTFLRAMEIPNTIDPQRNPAGFLMALSARLWRDELRKRSRRQRIAPHAWEGEGMDPVESAKEPTLTDEVAAAAQLQVQVRDAVDGLPDTLRMPVLLYYMADLSVQEIGRALRLPQGTVKSRLYHARQKLKDRLEGMGYGGQDQW